MIYVSSYNGSEYGVTDTDDNTEEFYTAEALLSFSKVMDIPGICGGSIKVTNPLIEDIKTVPVNTPFCIGQLQLCMVSNYEDKWEVCDMRTKFPSTLTREKLLGMGSKLRVSYDYDKRVYDNYTK